MTFGEKAFRGQCLVPFRGYNNVCTGALSGLHITTNIGQHMTCYKTLMMKGLTRLQFIMLSTKCSLMTTMHFPLEWVARRRA